MEEVTLKEGEYWIAGARSPSLGNYSLEHVVINEEYPLGRYTKDPRQAWVWAHEDAAHFNRAEEANGATDWIATIWPGIPTVEQVTVEPTQLGA
jgi:hypothetical protein